MIGKISFKEKFPSKEAKYEFFNFLRPSCAKQLSDLLTDSWDRPIIVLLMGEADTVEYALEASVYEVGRQKCDISIIPIEMDGYEEGPNSLQNFVRHLESKHQEYNYNKLDQIINGLQPTIINAFIISVIGSLASRIPIKDILDVMDSGPKQPDAPQRRTLEGISRLLSKISDSGRIVIYVEDAALLPENLRRELLYEVIKNPNLMLTMSSHSSSQWPRKANGVDIIPLDFSSLTKEEMRSLVDNRFHPNSFPEEFYDTLWRYSLGLPEQLTIKMRDLLGADIVIEHPSNHWCLAEGGIGSQEAVREFSTTFYDQFQGHLHNQLSEQMETFLSLAVLCGENVPIDLIILNYMGLNEDQRDEIINLIDDKLIEGHQRLFIDHQYNHPGFPGLLIYSFANPVLRLVILERLSKRYTQDIRQLYDMIKSKLPPYTRSAARLHLEIARHLHADQDIECLEPLLTWWVGQEDADILTQEMIDAIQEGSISLQAAWHLINISENKWPPYLRLAALNAYIQQPDGPPMNQLLDCDRLHAELLFMVGKYPEALAIAEMGLKLCSYEDNLNSALFHRLLGVIKTTLNRLHSALDHFKEALSIYRNEKFHEVNMAEINIEISQIYINQGKYSEAESLLNQALNIVKSSLGPDHPNVAVCMSNLGQVYLNQGKYSEAEPLLKQALNIVKSSLGPDHSEMARILNNLAMVYINQGKYSEAESLLNQALNIVKSSLGPDHPNVAVCMSNLGQVYLNQGKYSEAEPLLKQALNIVKSSLGPDHPYIYSLLAEIKRCNKKIRKDLK